MLSTFVNERERPRPKHADVERQISVETKTESAFHKSSLTQDIVRTRARAQRGDLQRVGVAVYVRESDFSVATN